MSKQQLTTGIAVAIGLLLVGYFFFNNPFSSTSTTVSTEPSSTSAATASDTNPNPNQVVVQDVSQGTGAEAQVGDTVEVNYIGKLQDGTVFDQTSTKSGPFPFTLGGNVIPGFTQGVTGMKVGGTRIIIIPPSLGYGSQAVGSIPANSTLIFQVELVKIHAPASSDTGSATTGQ